MDESSFSSHFNTFHRLAEIVDDAQRFKFQNIVEDPNKVALHREEFREIAESTVQAKENELSKQKILLLQLQSKISSLDNFSTFMTSMTAKYKQIEENYEKIVEFGKKFADIPAVSITTPLVTNEEISEVVPQQETEAEENTAVDCFGDVREPKLEDYRFSSQTMKWLKATEAGECCALQKPWMAPSPRRVGVQQQNNGIHDPSRHYSMATTPAALRNTGLLLTPGAFLKREPTIPYEIPARPVESCGEMKSPEEPVLLSTKWAGKMVPMLGNTDKKINTQTPESPVTPELTSRFFWSSNQ